MTKPTLFERKAKKTMAYRVYYKIIKTCSCSLEQSNDTKPTFFLFSEQVTEIYAIPLDKIHAIRFVFKDNSFVDFSSRGITYGMSRTPVKSTNKSNIDDYDKIFDQVLKLIKDDHHHKFYDNTL